jgi:AAA family ATP:ADP antiporter
MSTKPSQDSGFKGLRAYLWPIHSYELKKFVPLCLLMCLILFNYTVFRNTKDTLILTSAGAGTITFLKMYCVTPVAILFVILYAKGSNIFNSEKIFYATMAPFLVFFALFAFVLNPNLTSQSHQIPLLIQYSLHFLLQFCSGY